ncbi:glycosyltransferase family 4 protein [Kushneria sp. AK178]
MLVINSKFKSQRLTGVQRTAKELIDRFEQPYEEFVPAYHNRWYGIAWEQFALPAKIKKNDLLFSPCNIGPISHKNQVVCIHDVGVLEHPEWYNKKFAQYYNFVWSKMKNTVKQFTTVSHFSKERMVICLGIPHESIEIIPNGVSESFYAKQTISIVQSRFYFLDNYVLCVGSFDARKNQSVLLEAWQDIKERYPDVTLVFVGERGKNFNQDDIGSNDRGVVFTGYVSDEELILLYRHAQVFVYPSIYEGFGLPVLEAMASGTPVITSINSPMEEFAAEAGIMVDPKNISDIKGSLEFMLENESRREDFSRKGIAIAKSMRWEESAKAYENLFKRIEP